MSKTQYEKVYESVPVQTVSQKVTISSSSSAQKTTSSGGISSNTLVKDVPQTSLLSTVLMATGWGSIIATIGDFAAKPIIDRYKELISQFSGDNPDTSTLGELLGAISQINPFETPPAPASSSKKNLLDILSDHTNHLNRIAIAQEGIYRSSLTDQNSPLKTMIDGFTNLQKEVNDKVRSDVVSSVDARLADLQSNIDSVDNDVINLSSKQKSLDEDLTNTKEDLIKKSQEALKVISDSTDHLSSVNTDIARVLDSFAFDGLVVKKDEKDLALQDARLEHHEYQKTVVDVKDMDGNVVANVAPRELKNSELASTARKHTDQNNFELDDDDIDTMVGDYNISEMFTYSRLTDRLQTTLSDMDTNLN
ncbi:MAG: hypothetical protein PHX13_12650 [Thiovulaceae bacterium]|nr:hypothetical protein [Sulfurimonadaceae bacterium]